MSVAGPNFPTISSNDNSVGTVAWSNTDNIFLEDGQVATAATAGQKAVKEASVKLYQNSVIGQDRSTGATIAHPLSWITYGNQTDTWGLTLTDIEVNNPSFGVAFAATGISTGRESNYLVAKGFGFNLAFGSVVDGVVVEIKEGTSALILNRVQPLIDTIRITIYYH